LRDYFVELIDVTLRRETIESNDTGDPTTPKKGDARRVTDALCTARGSLPCEQRMVAYLFAIFIARPLRYLTRTMPLSRILAFFLALYLPMQRDIETDSAPPRGQASVRACSRAAMHLHEQVAAA